jgi:hypothetical protein
MLDTTPTSRRLRAEELAAERRARALALRQSGLTLRAVGRALDVSVEQARQMVLRANRLPHWRDALSARAINMLRQRELADLDELEAARAIAELGRREVLATPNFGKGAIADVDAWLERCGLKWRQP